MQTLNCLIRRNVKLFFKDKGLFFTSLITPAILLVLYVSFLGNVYRDAFLSSLPPMFTIPDRLVDGYIGGQLISSILAVSCVTVSFCSNMLMVQDRANGTIRDLTVSPLRPSVLAISYYVATLISTLIVCYAATGVCLVYVTIVGWYLSVFDVVLLLLDVLLLVMFGTALSSLINFFLSSQGQISAVGTVVSSGYGFICGAYMPISQFSEGLQTVISFLPGTYGTVLVRNHAMRGVIEEMSAVGVPDAVLDQMKDAIDCNLYFFDKLVSQPVLYLVLAGFTALVLGAYVLLHVLVKRRS